MTNVFDIYTIIFLALAVFIFFRLRSVLGTKTARHKGRCRCVQQRSRTGRAFRFV